RFQHNSFSLSRFQQRPMERSIIARCSDKFLAVHQRGEGAMRDLRRFRVGLRQARLILRGQGGRLFAGVAAMVVQRLAILAFPWSSRYLFDNVIRTRQWEGLWLIPVVCGAAILIEIA